MFLSTHFLVLGSMLSLKICEENMLECSKRQRKKRYLFCFHIFCLWISFLKLIYLFILPLAAAEQPVRDGENEGGAREEKVLLGTRVTQRKGESKGFRDIKRREYNIIMYNWECNLSVIPKARKLGTEHTTWNCINMFLFTQINCQGGCYRFRATIFMICLSGTEVHDPLYSWASNPHTVSFQLHQRSGHSRSSLLCSFPGTQWENCRD